MKTEKKYEQWKAITESDFVTLFIKTWFTYIASLRELNPDVKVFTEEGMPRGDKPFLNAYRDGIMPIVQKQLPIESLAQEMFRMYSVSMRKVIDVFPQYFFQTFFRVNESFHYTYRTIDKDAEGRFKERYELDLCIEKRFRLKFYLGMSGRFRTTNYNEQIKKEIDLRPIIEAIVSNHKALNGLINELQFMRDFYNSVMDRIAERIRQYTEETLPSKGYNQTINGKIKDICQRLYSALNAKFDYNYKYPHEVSALDDPNSYAIIYQLPFNGFGRVEQENIYSAKKDVYSQLMATKGVDWFASYVYSLRNALFHEIITPLDEEWQTIFKSAYLILKQVTDVCITTINGIIEFPQSQDNAVFDYASAHQDAVFSTLADHVELHDYPEMALQRWKIDHGKIVLTGWFLAKLKLQNGSAEEIEAGVGSIEEADKGFSFEVILNDDFSIYFDNEKNIDCISIQLQRP